MADATNAVAVIPRISFVDSVVNRLLAKRAQFRGKFISRFARGKTHYQLTFSESQLFARIMKQKSDSPTRVMQIVGLTSIYLAFAIANEFNTTVFVPDALLEQYQKIKGHWHVAKHADITKLNKTREWAQETIIIYAAEWFEDESVFITAECNMILFTRRLFDAIGETEIIQV